MITTGYKIQVMQAFLDGANIVKKPRGSSQIIAFFSKREIKNPIWDWRNFTYEVEKTFKKSKVQYTPCLGYIITIA